MTEPETKPVAKIKAKSKTEPRVEPKVEVKNPKLGSFKAPRSGAFYLNKRIFEGDPIEVTCEADWRAWMIPASEVIPPLKSFVPAECLPENQRVK